MHEKSDNYNLLVKRWIPILRTNGKPDRVGIREALTNAGRIRQIAASNPMDNVALLRLLLAVLHWCKPEPTPNELEQLRHEKAVGIPWKWLEKLGTEKEPNGAFNLLGDAGGFYQNHAATSVRVAVTNLLHDLPSGSKIAHFRHTRDDRDGMCLPCCALGLVRWPGVASAGTAGAGQSMTASINGNTPAYSVLIRANLLPMLLFRRTSSHTVEGDFPVWDGADEQSPLGFLKGLTWRSRSVLLAPRNAEGKRDLSPGRCCHCGEQTDRLVKSIVFRPGWKRFSKEPWSEDPHLLRVTRKTGQGTKEKKIVPSWPSPNDPLEEHARVWRSVLEGHLQRSVGSETAATEFHTTLLGNSQALYKQVGTHKCTLPGLATEMVDRLLEKMEWLRKVTWVTVAARGGNWRDPPKNHLIVEALCVRGAKGHAIRSGLAACSPLTEYELEKAVLELANGLVIAGQGDAKGIEQAVADWRRQARGILRNYVEHVVDATAPGSPLRRREARQRVDDAIRKAVRQVERQATKAPEKASADAGNEVGHDSD